MFKGISFSLFASCSFGFLYYYTSLLSNLNGHQAFGWRMLMLFPFLTLMLVIGKEFGQVKRIFYKILQQPSYLLLLILSAILSGIQLWLFVWAPMNGRGLQVSLGYFLLPLILILSGRFIFKEKISLLQKIALILATLGVFHEIWRIGSLSWESILVALGYSAYFILRKKINADHLGGFWWDILLMLPIAIYFIQTGHFNLGNAINDPYHLLLVTGLGLISALALGSYILSSRYLPLVLFGLLSYMEPILLAIVALLLGEKIEGDEWLTYIFIWIAVSLIMIEGCIYIFKNKQLLSKQN